MIYTVTLNPSLDFISHISGLKEGRTNQADSEVMQAGGRALTISRVLRALDMPTTATGFAGGRTGEFIEDQLEEEEISHHFIRTSYQTRINITLFSEGIETRILGHGSQVSIDEINELMYYLSRMREGDFLIMAGSLPPGMNKTVYDRMVEMAVVNEAGFMPILHAEYIRPMLDKHPLLITPTLKDMDELAGKKLSSHEEILKASLDLIDAGAQNIMVNLGKEGSLCISSDKKIYQALGPTDSRIVSDTYTDLAMAAGFIANYVRTNDSKTAFLSGQAASNATYYVTSLPERAAMEEAREQMELLPL